MHALLLHPMGVVVHNWTHAHSEVALWRGCIVIRLHRGEVTLWEGCIGFSIFF